MPDFSKLEEDKDAYWKSEEFKERQRISIEDYARKDPRGTPVEDGYGIYWIK